MNETLKWILIGAFSVAAVFIGAGTLGLDWDYLHSSILSIFETIGLLLILFTGSAAAIEIAKYYRSLSRSLQEEQQKQEHTRIDRDDVRALVGGGGGRRYT